jgi:nitrite reductase/ring-hydroxylating ferredoxin subunit
MFPFSTVDRLERAAALDSIAALVQKLARAAVPSQQLRDAVHGVWLGHPVHPLMVQVPIGAWLSAGLLDMVPGNDRATRRLIAAGLIAAGPSALVGASDLAEQHEQQLRVGVVHALANTVAVLCYSGSLLARVAGRARGGKALGYAGLGAVTVGGVLGGHIAYRQAAGANHAEQVPHQIPPGWHELIKFDELPERQSIQLAVHDVPVMAYRDGEQVHVLADGCSHLAGPLSDGEIVGDGAERCVVCPWHGSTFRLRDGAVVHGPATARQPALESRVRAGLVEVCLPGAG